MFTKRWIGIGAAIVLALISYFLLIAYHDHKIAAMGSITVIMAALWISEAIPLGATSLLPIALFPLAGIADVKMVTPLYGHHIIFLFIAGFLLAFAMEKWNLHQRIAYKIIGFIGFSPSRILIGFMLAAFLLSMWISNLATTILLLAPALAVIKEFEASGKSHGMYSIGLLLGIAYASSIGGTSTPIGTAPNLIFMSQWEENFQATAAIGFIDWMKFALPSAAIFAIICYWVIKKRFVNSAIVFESTEVKKRIKTLKPISFEECIVLIAFLSLMLLWLLKRDINFGLFTISGWANLFQNGDFIKDSSIGMAVVLLLFFIPSKKEKGQHLLEWKDAQRLPFDILFIFGGGFALAFGFKESGLGSVIATQLEPLASLPLWLLILCICLFMTFLTEITSNTATTQLILPILVIMAQVTSINPIYLMVPATLSASYAFMLPVATPPNAIVFGTNQIPLKEMMRTGLILNLLGAVLLSFLAYFFADNLI